MRRRELLPFRKAGRSEVFAAACEEACGAAGDPPLAEERQEEHQSPKQSRDPSTTAKLQLNCRTTTIQNGLNSS